ncbi:MAG: efflux RND transporter periplasmic adaptor subunit [Acidobacteriia bacterium]|nr:efflux RND transporter periplasmic adaptor subunit [Terriglobia bacterium]
MAENSKRKKIIWIAGAVLAVLVIVVLVVRRQAPLVPVVGLSREDLSATITSNGKVEPISATVARAEFPTFVDKVKAVEGQAVRRGQVILTLDAADVRSQLAQARASLLAAQTDLRNAHAGGPPDQVAQLEGDLKAAQVQVKNLETAEAALEGLVAKQAATQDELAQNQASLAKARANLAALEARKQDLVQRSSVSVEGAGLRVSEAQELVKSLDGKVRSATVIAPTDGTLYSLPVNPGDYVKVGDTLAEMADLRHVRVRAFVDEPDLGLLEPDQNVQVTWDAKPSRMWTGRTSQVPKQVVARGMRSVGEVLCSVDNSHLELLPNINVQVRIMVRERHGALVVPRAAVREDKGQHFVFLYADNRVRRRDISVGVASASKYEVLSGLSPDDRVALPGVQELSDGMEVRAGEAN